MIDGSTLMHVLPAFLAEQAIIVDPDQLIAAVNDQGYACRGYDYHYPKPPQMARQTEKQVRKADQPTHNEVLLKVGKRQTGPISVQQIVEHKPDQFERDEEEPDQRLAHTQTHDDGLRIDEQKERTLPERVVVFQHVGVVGLVVVVEHRAHQHWDQHDQHVGHG